MRNGSERSFIRTKTLQFSLASVLFPLFLAPVSEGTGNGAQHAHASAL